MQNEEIDILILDFLNRKITPENLRILNEWVTLSTENKRYFEQIKKTWMISSAHQPADANAEDAYNRFVNRINNKKIISKTSSWKKYMAYAAAIVILLISVPFLLNRVRIEPEIHYSELNIPRGSKLNVVLPDGSTAWINADSKLTYSSDFGRNNRNIELEGEGYFEVIPGEIPFIISTDSAQIKVLGTKFNVRNYKDDKTVRVSLLEGSVLFSSNEKEYLLDRPQIVDLDKVLNAYSVVDSRVEYSNKWINNHMFFDEISFGEIALVLERAFDVNILFSSDELKNLIFYGDFVIEANNLEEILKVMASTNKFKYKYKIEHRKVYITSDNLR